VAVDRIARAVALWSLCDGAGCRGVQAAARGSLGAYAGSATLALIPPGEGAAGGPATAVAFPRVGTALAVWVACDAAACRLQSSTLARSDVWGAPELVTDQAPGGIESVDVALDATGDAVAVWASGDAVQAATRPAGGSWGAPDTIAPGGRHVDLAVNGAGEAVAAWTTIRFSTSGLLDGGIQAATRTASGLWEAPETLSDATNATAQVAIDPFGTATAVWSEETDRVMTARRPAAGAWSAPEELAASGGGPPRVGVDGGGTVVAVWGGASGVRAWVRPLAGAPQQALLAASGTPRVAVGGLGTAIAAWQRTEGGTAVIEAAVRPLDGPWGTTQTLSAPDDRPGVPEVAVEDPYGASVVWASQDSATASRVRAALPVVPRPTPAPAAGTPRCLPAPAAPAAGSPPASGAGFHLTAAQLRTNQRIAQAAIRRLNGVEAWLDSGIEGRDLCGGAIGAAKLSILMRTALAPLTVPLPLPLPDPRPVVVPPAVAGGGRIRVSAEQLLIDQRIAQAALRRAAAIEARLAGTLTASDLVSGAISPDRLAPRLAIIAVNTSGREPERSRTVIPARPDGPGDPVTATTDQLRINQRVAQAAVRRANALIARLGTGLTGAEFADGSITDRTMDSRVFGSSESPRNLLDVPDGRTGVISSAGPGP
jgi:hypothetical protein